MSQTTPQTPLNDQARRLALVPLFQQLEEPDLVKLAEEVDEVFFKSGEAIFHTFDHGDALYLIESGSVRVWVHDDYVKEITLSQLKPGDFLANWLSSTKASVLPMPRHRWIVHCIDCTGTTFISSC